MSLQPTAGLLGEVLKMAETDPAAAHEFVRLGLYESLLDQIEVQRPVLEANALVLIQKRAAQARSQLLRDHVGKALEGGTPADASIVAKNLAIIDAYVEKSLIGNLLSQFNDKHPRDQDGQFVKVPLNSNAKGTANQHANEKVLAQRQVESWTRGDSLGLSGTVTLHTKKGRKTDTVMSPVNSLGITMDRLHADGQNVTHISHDPRSSLDDAQPQQRAAYDAVRATTGDPAMAGRIGRALPYDKETGRMANGDDAAENWNNLTDGTDRRSYRRMQMTGQALQAISDDGSNMQTIGGLAQLMGDIGPEAEKILAPGFQRIAYRYRGTEKRPNAQLMTQIKEANEELAVIDPEIPGNVSRQESNELMGDAERRRVELSNKFAGITSQGEPVNGVLGYYATQTKLDPDERAMRVRGDLAVVELADQVPNKKLSALSTKSGQTPPSLGIMIDADGNVVTEAMGFNGDHYLPFDLKNLKGMHGGQYARTRVTGGPTTEDIYTGLMAGARQMQVVSNSGVFTVEFDPDLRGGRRYSDKAAKMVTRYGKILDAVGNGEKAGLYRTDISGKEKAEMWTNSMDSVRWDAKAGDTEFKSQLAEARLKSSGGISSGELQGDELTSEKIEREVTSEISEMTANMKQAGRSLSSQQLAQATSDLRREKQAEAESSAVRPYKLDGDGYHDALRALQAEFPYYIKSVDYKRFPDFYGARKLGPPPPGSAFAADPAYVAPGQTRSASEQKSMYGSAVQVGGVEGRKAREAKAEKEKAENGNGHTNGNGTASLNGNGGGSNGRSNGVMTGGQQISLFDTTFATDRETQFLGDVMKRAQRVLTTDLNSFMAVVNRSGLNDFIEPPEALIGDETPDQMDARLMENSERRNDPIYFIWKYNNLDSAANFADWVLNKATDRQRKVISTGINRLPNVIAGTRPEDKSGIYDAFGGKEQLEADVKKLDGLASLGNPYAPPDPNAVDPIYASPATTGNPKPQRFKEIEALGITLKNFKNFEESARKQGKAEPFFTVLQEIEQTNDNIAIGMEIQNRINTYDEIKENPKHNDRDLMKPREDLELWQRAWSYVHAKKIAETVDRGEGALPLVLAGQTPAKPAADPRVIVAQAPPGPGPLRAGGVTKSLPRVQWELPGQFSEAQVLEYLGL